MGAVSHSVPVSIWIREDQAQVYPPPILNPSSAQERESDTLHRRPRMRMCGLGAQTTAEDSINKFDSCSFFFFFPIANKTDSMRYLANGAASASRTTPLGQSASNLDALLEMDLAVSSMHKENKTRVHFFKYFSVRQITTWAKVCRSRSCRLRLSPN